MIASIVRRRTFDELRRHGRRVRHGSVRLSFLPLETVEPQVAFAIGRSFGNAVERNRGRRRLRAAFVEAFGGTRSVVGTGDAAIGRIPATGTPALGATFGELQGAFLLTGTRGLLTDRFPKLVNDVKVCLEKLRT